MRMENYSIAFLVWRGFNFATQTSIQTLSWEPASLVQIGVQERAATDSKQSLEQSHSERMAELEAELTQLQEKLEAAELGFEDTSRKLDNASQTHDEAVSQLNAHVTCPSRPIIILSALLPPHTISLPFYEFPLFY